MKTVATFPQIVGVEAVQTRNGTYAVIEVKSESNPNKVYRVDVTNHRCSCPAWVFQRKARSERSPCKHLKSLGFTELVANAKRSNQPVVVDGVTLL